MGESCVQRQKNMTLLRRFELDIALPKGIGDYQ